MNWTCGKTAFFRSSTWNMLRILFVCLFLAACSKPDPQPELKDRIYLDMKSELDISEKALAEVQKTLAEHQAALGKVVPQTGQIRYAQKRVWEAEAATSKIEQQKKYWIIRMDDRKMYVRKKSLESFHKGQEWDDPKEWEAYDTEKRLRRAKLQWDVRQRREDFLKELSKPAIPGSGEVKK